MHKTALYNFSASFCVQTVFSISLPDAGNFRLSAGSTPEDLTEIPNPLPMLRKMAQIQSSL